MKKSTTQTTRLEEGLHFYIEDGKYVFTAYFLKSRAYCCGSGCRHCPYEKNDSLKPIEKQKV